MHHPRYASWPPASRGEIPSRPFFPGLPTNHDGRPVHTSWPPRALQYDERVLRAITDIPLNESNAHLTSEMHALRNLHAYNTGQLAPEHAPRLYGLLRPSAVEGLGCRQRMAEYLRHHALDVAAGSTRCAACMTKLARAYSVENTSAFTDDESSAGRASAADLSPSDLDAHAVPGLQDLRNTMGWPVTGEADSACASTSSMADNDLCLSTTGLSGQGSASNLMSPDTPGAYSVDSSFPADLNISSSVEDCATSGRVADDRIVKGPDAEFYVPRDWDDLARFKIGDYELSDDE